ncbi:glycoside hydrolase family 97 catalytic domain-containing protein [Actinophytocola gossypii]|uniref:Glycoside hydrolase family 97 catalytic domain-containing protein n=1 Tax=Actinophytocola gossypii TaxID=2812003 RepID=A0ABT2JGF8_9PSEU|nr:glycoside hydrolase family 97 catalytic domain-containing protein [Actinophytocola gossypii]MCT2586948.1 glycoside hydrolase family 97 catalytic domain-containing protein [Actinophytocola gossypii]
MPSLSRLAAGVTVAALALAGTTVPATAAPRQDTWTVSQRGISAEVGLTDGALHLDVERHGRTVLSGALGLHTTGADLSSGLRAVDDDRRTVVERYETTTGKQRHRATPMSELRLELRGADDARMDLVVRVAADGVAYRYELPEAATITGEASAYTLPEDAPAWLLPYNAWYEQNRVATTAGGAEAGDFGHPSLFEVGEDFALLTESDVDGRYSGSRLRHTEGTGEYHVVLADETVTADRTPWRTAIVGDLATVTESTLVDDLASPSKIRDTSWIRPGKVAWSWLSDHSSPSDFERQKEFVDFAARNNWYAVLVDEGWSAEWVPELVRYARARGVEILLWFHWTRLDTAEEQDTVLPLVKSWGVRGVKLDFMESDTQERYRWYDTVLAKTASLELMVNFHGSTIPHGLARTWPHIMTMEAVRGAENYPLPVNNPVQAFTRNVVGSMDYTPVSLDTGIQRASVAHEVALPVVYESGWQHFADSPEAYERHPEALRFLNQVPTTWDETELVAGHPSRGAVFARRGDDRWFLGAISAGEPRTVSAPLRFLDGGRWLVEVIRDGEGPRGDVVRSSRVLTARDTLSVEVAADGGFAAIACRAWPGRTTCDEPLQHVPSSTLDVSPAGEVDVTKGESFEVTATFHTDRDVRDVRLSAVAPSGWSVSGRTVTRHRLPAGEHLTARWTVHVGQDSPSGYVDVPVVAEFDAPRWSDRVHVERAVRTFVPPPPLAGEPWVSDVPFVAETNGWGPVERDRSVNESAAGDGNPLTIDGVVYEKGLGTHAPSRVEVYLGGQCSRFDALVGLDDETTEPGSVAFRVLADGAVRYDSGLVRPGPGIPVSVDVSGARMLTLEVTDGGDGKNFDHADWADARLTC